MTPKQLLAKLPPTIKIGPLRWSLKHGASPPTEPEEHKVAWGFTDPNKLRIWISDQSPSPEFTVGVLLHEMYHAALHSFNVPAQKKEEQQAMFNELWLVSVFQDNPWLLDWIKKGLK